MYKQPNYEAFRKNTGICPEDIANVLKGPDSPGSVHHPLFDSSMADIIDAAIMYARSNGKKYWRPYVLEKWARREDCSRMKVHELMAAKEQITKVTQDEQDKVLMMYISRSKPFRIRR